MPISTGIEEEAVLVIKNCEQGVVLEKSEIHVEVAIVCSMLGCLV